jgi:hypothetical protein
VTVASLTDTGQLARIWFFRKEARNKALGSNIENKALGSNIENKALGSNIDI